MYIVRCIYFLILFAVCNCWYTCDNKVFCQKIRNKHYGESAFELVSSSMIVSESNILIDLLNGEDGKVLKLSLTILEGDIFRVIIDDPNKPRHIVTEAINGELQVRTINVEQENERITVDSGSISAVLNVKPFKIDIYRNGELLNKINPQGKLVFMSEEDDEAIALDLEFPDAERAYGLPLHAERLSLKTTGVGGLNPYRLYNVDHCCYNVDSQDPLYGAVPVLYAHSTSRTTGIFWLNSAQTFVDINNADKSVEAHIISESGAIDLFILTGPTLAASARQYTKITGTAPLPPYFAMAYHQSRYSYMSQRDVLTVVEEFDKHNFPLDVMWLDIDYTDSYKYFTWNSIRFPRPIEMQQTLNMTGRKLVVIIDPHIKIEDGYFVYDTANTNGYFVKNPDGSNFEGECWPGLSSYIDFHNPDALNWCSSLYSLNNFAESTDIMFIWNDMNEPSVFEQDETTMPNYLLHYGGWIHRDVHNMYGFMQTMGTWKGLMARLNYKQRPFILTRSHFAGTQRFAAIWTGDNMPTWEHLKVSFSMCLTEALAGISFCGADIGGFIANVETELLERWYQAGAWLPFFRQHSTTNIDRREPYLYPQDVQVTIRKVLRNRYSHLPYWYTIWYEHERNGDPVIRPISYHYPEDSNTLDMDDQWLIGKDIMVHPVVKKGANKVTVYFPGGEYQLWFDIENGIAYRGIGYIDISVTIDYTPVFYRGGSIIIRKDIARQSSSLTHKDPYSLYIFLDNNNEAVGNLYCDDNESFEYRAKKYIYYQFIYSNSSLKGEKLDKDADFGCMSSISNIYIFNLPKDVRKLWVTGKESTILTTSVSKIEVNDLNINVNLPFFMQL